MSETKAVDSVVEGFGSKAFTAKVMRHYLSEGTFKSLQRTMSNGGELDASIADEVAEAMKTWAMEHGATHFTHWFQPLTGATAEKHDSFLLPDGEGGAIAKFSGSELIQGEPDASSFPSGGLRATFEARGYTGWDPTSPAFLKDTDCGYGGTLCIPTVFCGYHGEALDKKTPLMRSMQALNEQICRLGKIFGVEGDERAYATLGSEQEYFLVDRELYEHRIDLLQTGRTLFGRAPAKHQQLDDHYFGAVKARVMCFMADVDHELWALGMPARTRHNEVCPAQFEIAPMFEELNLAVDHNMITMEVLRNVAERHNLVCLLHEKPYAGVNGSGKHNNWAVCGPDGKNWLTPGENPHENAKFLTMIVALMKAVDTHADLLRTSVASAGNDHRLGANEAPPAIISIFLGDQLTDIIEQLEAGGAKSAKEGGTIELGVTSLPSLPRGNTDRNRTSPFAFTGNKFEFRAVGSNMSCAGPAIVLNTIVAESLDEICTRVEADVADGKDVNDSLQVVLPEIIKQHKRVLFNGDNYTDEWVVEAEKRGLPNLKKTPESLETLKSDRVKNLFAKYKVLSNQELNSRYEVYTEAYETLVQIEANCALNIARTQISPAAMEAAGELAETVSRVEACGLKVDQAKALMTATVEENEKLLAAVTKLEKQIADEDEPLSLLATMETLREAGDALEALVPDVLWPLPSYAELLFMM